MDTYVYMRVEKTTCVMKDQTHAHVSKSFTSNVNIQTFCLYNNVQKSKKECLRVHVKSFFLGSNENLEQDMWLDPSCIYLWFCLYTAEPTGQLADRMEICLMRPGEIDRRPGLHAD